jgi:hypothetical protein
MQQQQFIDIIKQPLQLESAHLAELEVLVNEYPFFESAHLLYIKGLHKYQAINYSKQLRKTAIVANSRSVLYELLHQPETIVVKDSEVVLESEFVADVASIISTADINEQIKIKQDVSSVSITNNDIKVIYVNTVTNNSLISEKEAVSKEIPNEEINIIKSIENETEAPIQEFDVDKLNKNIEQEISKGIIQSYVETDIIKTPELNKEEVVEPSSFTDWLKTIQKESHTFQTDTKKELPENIKSSISEQKKAEIDKKPSFFSQNKQIIDKIIESDPGRIKLGSTKFFTPASDAKQSLLENEHLVTETLAKIYALQGNISKAIRAYEILSLKFPQKSVYFATLIEKLKTNK